MAQEKFVYYMEVYEKSNSSSYVLQSAFFDKQIQAHSFALLFCYVNEAYGVSVMKARLNPSTMAYEDIVVCEHVR